MIKVLFFARLREVLNCDALELAYIPDQNVAELKQSLIEQNPSWQKELSANKILVAINQTMANDSLLLHDGDEVAFFPPVTGG